MAYRAEPRRLAVLPFLLALLSSFHAPLRVSATGVAGSAVAPLPLAVRGLSPTASQEDRARLLNAAIPFADSVGPAAPPFVLAGDESSRQRATDCLATVMWYEAGADPDDQRAVGQVVLNRVRHPAFPSSICGTAFEGSTLPTGCQFTFTCDGSMRQRQPSAAQFARARAVAAGMLAGATDPRVGLATHYHTDWVHPSWSGSMVKLARVGTHLFFRWQGVAGSRSFPHQAYAAQEPIMGPLSGLSPTHVESDLLDAGDAVALVPVPMLEVGEAGRQAPEMARAAGLRLSVSPDAGAAVPALAALDLCGSRPSCKVLGFAEESDEVVFVYVRDRRTGVEQTIWDCSRFSRRNTGQCLGPQTRRWIDFEGSLSASGSS